MHQIVTGGLTVWLTESLLFHDNFCEQILEGGASEKEETLQIICSTTEATASKTDDTLHHVPCLTMYSMKLCFDTMH